MSFEVQPYKGHIHLQRGQATYNEGLQGNIIIVRTLSFSDVPFHEMRHDFFKFSITLPFLTYI